MNISFNLQVKETLNYSGISTTDSAVTLQRPQVFAKFVELQESVIKKMINLYLSCLIEYWSFSPGE